MAESSSKTWLGWLVAFVFSLGCSGASPTADGPNGPPRILILSSPIGYIEPCGCTVDLLLGGIDRVAATVVAERKKGPTAVVVVGPHLF